MTKKQTSQLQKEEWAKALQMIEDFAKVEEEETTTFCKVKTPVGGVVEIDKFALQKLLMSKPPGPTPIEDQKTTYLRCNREGDQDVWEAYVEGKRTEFRSGILVNANLATDEKDVRVGCGGSYYIGMAAGHMVSENHPVQVPNAQVRRLWFDDRTGVFYDRDSLAEIKSCDYLMLKPDCHAEWIASPEQLVILKEMEKLRYRGGGIGSPDYDKAQRKLDRLGKPHQPTEKKGTK